MVINTKFILGRIYLPNRKINSLAQNTMQQNNILQAVRFSFTWQRDIFINGFFQIENERSNYSGLTNSKIVFGLTPVFQLGTKWFLRGDFKWQQKSYKKPDERNQLIGIDPEIGEGNDLNLDVVFMLKQRYSVIARINLQKHESILRNRYYSKNIFECILEIK